MTGSENTPNDAGTQPPASPAAGDATSSSGAHEQAQASSVDSPPTAPPSATPQPNVTPAPVPATADDDLDLPQSPLPEGYYTADGTPTFDAVAERIQQRIATADGNQVLDGESMRGRDEADDYQKLQDAGKDRLDQLRKTWGMDK